MAARSPVSVRALATLPLCLILTSGTFADSPRSDAAIAVATPSHPREHKLERATPFDGDLRHLPHRAPVKAERPEREEPEAAPIPLPGTESLQPAAAEPSMPARSAPAPSPVSTFEGLDYASWGAGHPPDTNGDVGPTYFIETMNTSIGIFRKSDGARVAAFTFDTFMSQGKFGNLCDTNNFGDPVVLYDTFEDRWIISDFAFQLDASGNVINPPGSFQCFAVSKSGDPVSGGWNFYSINTAGGLGDYPKLGIWPDGLYMSVNMFDYAATGAFQNARLYAFNKAQMYAGAPTIQSVSFDLPSTEFTVLPANARLQAGTPPAGAPNYFAEVWNYTNAISIYKFHVDWNSTSTSTLTGPFNSIAPASWANAPATVPSPANSLETLAPRLMVQNQYTNQGGVESLWNAHTVQGAVSTQSSPRYYQVTVTGNTVAATTAQAATYTPDAVNRFLPSVAVDRAGNMAMGYSATTATLNPAIRYAGRLSGDAVNTITQTEASLIEGTGTQSGNCGSSSCTRWGDYAAMTLDPDGCTFWYVSEYYQVTGLNDNTRIGSFKFPSCTPVTPGTLQGTVTSGGTPIPGAKVTLGSRTTTTDAAGFYSFTSLPAGTYPALGVSNAGYGSASATSLVVPGGGTLTKDFALTAAPASACLTDTTQADFQAGVPVNLDLTTTPGNAVLSQPAVLDQANTSLSTSGNALSATAWWAQTFTAGLTGKATQADVNLFCSGCTGTAPNLTLSIRATSGGLPTGADLASTTLTGNGSGAASYFSGTFAAQPTLTAGAVYALVVRPVSNPSAGTYAATASGSNVYAAGQRLTSANAGSTWAAPGGAAKDLGFRIYMKGGYAASGSLVSSLKDANPAAGFVPSWGTFTSNFTAPVNSTLLVQVAASNDPNGPFTYVGPDGTAATSFSSGASLAQFTGSRYLRYKAALSSTNSAVTPTLNDVTVCFDDVAPSPTQLGVANAAGTFGGATTLSATLTTTGGQALSGRAVSFNVSGVNAGSASTNAAGIATLSGVSLTGINAGTYPLAVAASYAGETLYGSSTASGSLTVAKASQAISFGALADKLATDAAFTVSATGGGSGNAVSFSTASTACSVSGSTVTLLAAGACSIDADQAASANYEAAPRVTRTFNVALAPQTISFPAIATFPWSGGSATLAATATSGLAVAYSVSSGPCAVSGTTLTATAAGACVVAANQPGDARYSAAPQVTAPATAGKASQAISFGALADKIATDAAFAISATGGGSGNAVTFSTASTACSVSGSTVTLLAGGSCAIAANQAGNGDYDAAPQVMQTFNVAKASQFIDFPAIAAFGWNGGSATLGATASSSLPVSYTVVSGPCAVSGSTLTATSAGGCTIAANQPGNARYAAAAEVTAVANSGKAAQAIAFAALANKVATDDPFTLAATGGGSGNPVTFSTTSVACNVQNGVVTLETAGTCAISANQAGDANYDAAPQVTRTFDIALAPQGITFPAIAAFTWKGGSAPLAASASSGLPVAYSVAFGPCSIEGTTLTALAAGSCVIAANQPGSARYGAAAEVTAPAQADKAPQSIGFGVLAGKIATDAPFTLTALAGASGNPISFATSSTACSVSGNVVTLLSAGSCTITADEAGDANYLAAPQVSQSFNVSLAAQSIAFPAVAAFRWSGGSATLAATATSGLPVAYTVLSGPCALSGTTLTATAAGACDVAADQPGDGRYQAAQRAVHTVTVDKALQAIAFAPLPDRVATDASFSLAAVGGASGYPVTYSTASTACAINGDTVSLLTAGPCVIDAAQAGDANYEAAPVATQAFSIAHAAQAITFPAVAAFSWGGGSATLEALSSSGLAVTYGVVSGPCAVAGATLTASDAGTCVVSADQAGDARYSAAPQATVTVTVGKAAQTIAFPAIAAFSWSGGSATLSASASSSLPVSYSVVSGPCAVSGATVTATQSGTCVLAADQAGNASYAAAAQGTQTVSVTHAPQSITFPAVAPFPWGGAAALSATASSGLAVSYSVTSGPCALVAGALTATAPGACVVAADQGGDVRYSAAAQVSITVEIVKAAQAIAFGALPGRLATDAAFTLEAGGGASGNPVVFSTASAACTVSGNVVTLLFAGACEIAAEQAGDANYLAAQPVLQAFVIALAPQSIAFPAVDAFTWRGGSATLAATSSAGLPVSYALVSGPCALSGTTVTATHAGVCTIAAAQAGDNRYGPAPEATATVHVNKAAQTAKFGAPPSHVASDAAFTLSAEGGASGNPVVFSTASTACSVSGNTVSLLTAGTCAIDADEAGNDDYLDAARITQAFDIAHAQQSLTFRAIAPFDWHDGPVTLAATATSGLAATYAVLSGPCTVSGNLLSATGAGTCEIAADQPGDARYAAAQRIVTSVTITEFVEVKLSSGGGCGGCASSSHGAGPAFEIAFVVLGVFALRRRKLR